MKKSVVAQDKSNTSKAHHFTTLQELIILTNSELEDVLYIGEKLCGRNYRSDFTFKTKAEVVALSKKNKANIKESDFFVYNERTGETVPFKKNDYMLYDRWYFSFDGKNYVSYDDNGNEVGNFPCSSTLPC